MAAVQRTPTPVDTRSRRAFIESMEEELRRVQDHLDRRQWKQRNGLPHQPKRHQSRQYNSMSRSNPATKRRLWDQRDKEEEGEDSDEVFCRVSSAQDTVRRSSTPALTSSSDSKSPSPSPEPIRVKSPQRLPSTKYAPDPPSFSSPVRSFSPREQPLSLSSDDTALSSYMEHKSILSGNPRQVIDTTPLMVKEMSFPFKHAVYPGVSLQYENEDDEEDNVQEKEETREVMPSALEDLLTEELQRGHLINESANTTDMQEVSVKSRDKDNTNHNMRGNNEKEVEEEWFVNPVSIEDEDIEMKSIAVKKEYNVTSLNEKNQFYKREQLRRMRELQEEKAQSNRQLSLLIEQLQIQLREKEREIELIHSQHLMELNVREDRIKKLSRQNARLEREKWDLLKKAREAAERSVNLRTKLDINDASLRSIEVELEHKNDELSAVKSANNSLRALVRDLRATKPVVDAAIQVDIRPSLVSMGTPPDMQRQQEEIGESDSGHASGGGGAEVIVCEDWGERVSIASSQCEARVATPTNIDRHRRERRSVRNFLNRFRRASSTGKRHSVSSLSQRSTSSLDNLQLSQTSLSSHSGLHHRSNTSSPNPYRLSTVSLQDVSDPHAVLEEFRGTQFQQWNTRAIVAWMEVVVGMPQYISSIRQYVTSGHAMLALTNSDMEKRLSISHPLHRRRLRLAIEELRRPSSNSHFPEASTIDHNWVAYTWAIDCGLPHLSSSLYNGMVDGRVLNSLSRDDIKKYLKITKKLEQLSFLSGVELLRMHEFRREAIHAHRQTTNNPLYWTNTDVCLWLKKINMEEYADHVTACGVHGALLFLERGYFNSEQLAHVIHLPNKSPLRRHLANQLAKLFSTDDINSIVDEEEQEQLPQPLETPQNSSPLLLRPTSRPTSPRPSSGDFSPHPSRRMMTHTSSNPDLTEPPISTFVRNQQSRRSLRDSAIRSVQVPQDRRRLRPIGRVVSTSVV